MTSDDTVVSSGTGNGYVYTWDVFGRLVKVQTNAATPVTIAEYKYDARHHRIAWRHPQAGGGGSAPEAQWRYAIYDHRWRMVAVERALAAGGTEWYERLYYHNAGLDGDGDSSYIDATIARDRDANLDIGTDGLEERLYYAQNWRGDVVALIRPNAFVAERVRYSAYGRPFNVQAADFNASGYVNWVDWTDYIGAYGGGGSEAGDHNYTGNVSVDDYSAYLNDYYDGNNISTGDGWDRLSRADHGNRKGYAGYEHDPYEPVRMLARHRWYRGELGTWMSRDPLQHRSVTDLYLYVSASPIIYVDPEGLIKAAVPAGGGCSTCKSGVGDDLQTPITTWPNRGPAAPNELPDNRPGDARSRDRDLTCRLWADAKMFGRRGTSECLNAARDTLHRICFNAQYFPPTSMEINNVYQDLSTCTGRAISKWDAKQTFLMCKSMCDAKFNNCANKCTVAAAALGAWCGAICLIAPPACPECLAAASTLATMCLGTCGAHWALCTLGCAIGTVPYL